MPANQPEISKLIESAFTLARSRYPELDKAWVALSMRLANSIAAATFNIQRAGSLDLVLRSMEAELAARMKAKVPPDFAFHYQKMFSEIWVGSAYEIARALAQRAREAVQQPDAKLFHSSVVARLSSLLADLERLRVPIEKYEIARDSAIKEPMKFAPVSPAGHPNSEYFYDPKDPRRDHIMPSGLSDRGSVMWLALDAKTSTEYWLERRALADRFLNLVSDNPMADNEHTARNE